MSLLRTVDVPLRLPWGVWHDADVSDETATQLDSVQARVQWPAGHPVLRAPHAANQMALQVNTAPDGVTPDAILIAFGFVSPPLVIGSEEEQRAFIESMKVDGQLVLDVEPVTRISISPAVAERFLEVLTDVVGRVRAAQAEAVNR